MAVDGENNSKLDNIEQYTVTRGVAIPDGNSICIGMQIATVLIKSTLVFKHRKHDNFVHNNCTNHCTNYIIVNNHGLKKHRVF